MRGTYSDANGAGPKQQGGQDRHAPRRTVDRPDPYLVLIADDERPIAETLSFIVLEAGYTPMVAAHGAAALELARQRRPALVITDLMMPHLAGDRLIAAIREGAASEGHPAPPIIVMTAASPRNARMAGADAVLNKPFDLAEVEALLYRFLGPPPHLPAEPGTG